MHSSPTQNTNSSELTLQENEIGEEPCLAAPLKNQSNNSESDAESDQFNSGEMNDSIMDDMSSTKSKDLGKLSIFKKLGLQVSFLFGYIYIYIYFQSPFVSVFISAFYYLFIYTSTRNLLDPQLEITL